jgi:hypothetical protein
MHSTCRDAQQSMVRRDVQHHATVPIHVASYRTASSSAHMSPALTICCIFSHCCIPPAITAKRSAHLVVLPPSAGTWMNTSLLAAICTVPMSRDALLGPAEPVHLPAAPSSSSSLSPTCRAGRGRAVWLVGCWQACRGAMHVCACQGPHREVCSLRRSISNEHQLLYDAVTIRCSWLPM